MGKRRKPAKRERERERERETARRDDNKLPVRMPFPFSHTLRRNFHPPKAKERERERVWSNENSAGKMR